tara:strand:+ start:362 stop:577 length:216 start_codon:yes stop_codon:yes gene_type:complete
MFKIGDKVRYKKKHKEYLNERWKEGVAKVIDFQEDGNRRQFCRISFDKKADAKHMLVDYDDVGSWLLERVE